jgi:hypothetical protein
MVLDGLDPNKATSCARIALYIARRTSLAHHPRATLHLSRANSVRVRLQSLASACRRADFSANVLRHESCIIESQSG